MKKIFKKSILIVICFILGSIACISVGVYAYSYSATDIEYTSGKSVKDAIDDLYIKEASRKVIVEISSSRLGDTYGEDNCNEASVGCVCYYLYNYVYGMYDIAPGYFPKPSTVGQKFNYGTHTGCQFASYGCNSRIIEGTTRNWYDDYSLGKCGSGSGYLYWETRYWKHPMGPEIYRCNGTLECDT